LGLSDNRYTVKRAAFHEVPAYLSAADAAIAFYKPTLSRLATSPVKVAEYLACGLPVVLNAGVGDSDALIRNERVGTVIENFTDAEYEQAATAIERFTAEPELIRRRAREVAERIFDVRTVGAVRYARLYERVLGGTN